jgi:hypothetical protein
VEKWELVASPRQCSSPHSFDGPTVFDKQQHGDCASSTLLTRSGSIWLFFVSTDEEKSERKAILWCGWSQRKHANCFEQYPASRVPALFWALEKSLG